MNYFNHTSPAANGIISWISRISVTPVGMIRRRITCARSSSTEIDVPDAAAMGVAVEGSETAVTNGEIVPAAI